MIVTKPFKDTCVHKDTSTFGQTLPELVQHELIYLEASNLDVFKDGLKVEVVVSQDLVRLREALLFGGCVHEFALLMRRR